VKEGEYQGNSYINCKLRSEGVAEDRILKYKVDAKKVDFETLNSKKDEEITVVCEVVSGQGETASLKIVGLES